MRGCVGFWLEALLEAQFNGVTAKKMNNEIGRRAQRHKNKKQDPRTTNQGGEKKLKPHEIPGGRLGKGKPAKGNEARNWGFKDKPKIPGRSGTSRKVVVGGKKKGEDFWIFIVRKTQKKGQSPRRGDKGKKKNSGCRATTKPYIRGMKKRKSGGGPPTGEARNHFLSRRPRDSRG